MQPPPRVPDYAGAWIGAILPALRASRPPEWLPEPAVTARQVVLLILDGLGWELFQRHADRLPALHGMDGGPIDAAVPSTTATGLPSITTGLTPGEHGLLGFRIAVDGGVLNVLRWRMDERLNRAPDPDVVQPVPPFEGRTVPVVTKSEFLDTGFTRAHLRGVPFRGWETPAVLREQIRAMVATGAPVIYAYYEGLDKVAHAHGLTGPAFLAEVDDTDRLVAEVRASLPRDCALLVTADHGHVAVGPDAVVPLPRDIAKMVRVQSGESRFRSLFAKHGQARALFEACCATFGDVAWVTTRDQAIAEGWFGPEVPPEHRQRLGDVILAPHAPIAFSDPSYPREDEMASRHGSLTDAEVRVPLLAARGEA